MTVRSAVQALVALGPFPSEDDVELEDLTRRQELLEAVPRPVSREEAEALLGCFGPDGAYGLSWSLLHVIETAPEGAPISQEPGPTENEWVRLLWDRANRSMGE